MGAGVGSAVGAAVGSTVSASVGGAGTAVGSVMAAVEVGRSMVSTSTPSSATASPSSAPNKTIRFLSIYILTHTDTFLYISIANPLAPDHTVPVSPALTFRKIDGKSTLTQGETRPPGV